MTYLLDSSVVAPALADIHPHYARALPWLARAARGEIQAIMTAHSLAESYSALTLMPVHPRIPPGVAWRLLNEGTSHLGMVSLTEADYRQAIQRVAELGLPGGFVYDALIACVAARLKVDGLVTFNVRHFQRVWPEGHDRIIVP
ncbi:MAG TPA: PIN domain-containing protein [Planctomycetota bacterium]|nr:PIN domain-containing protein [Planctomycetota bacterium]